MRNILVLGGDCRQISLAESFMNDGHNVSIYGFDPEYISYPMKYESDFNEAMLNDIIITGLPFSSDSKTINTPLYSDKIFIDDFVKKLKKDQIILGGIINKQIKEKISKLCYIEDYFEREELIIRNVVPTVEGAVSIAINETPITINKSKCLIIGYGRIGKYLSDILYAMRADVTVSARNIRDFARIDCYSYKYIKTNEISNFAGDYNIIFNTVPHLVVDKLVIDKINKDCVVIDLASKPGGIDFNYAAEKGIKVIWALSLPGKTAPVTAGRIIKETADNLLNDLGV